MQILTFVASPISEDYVFSACYLNQENEKSEHMKMESQRTKNSPCLSNSAYRNLPTFLVGTIAAVIIALGGTNALGKDFLIKSPPYQLSLAAVEGNPAAIDALGSPIVATPAPGGSVSYDADSGKVDLSINVSGPEGKGSIKVVGTKTAGVWTFQTWHLKVEGQEKVIALNNVDTSSANDTLKVKVPEKYAQIWPLVSFYYSDMIWNDDMDSNSEMAEILPDSIKHPALSPIFMLLAVIGVLAGNIWFLVEEFKISVWWGLGQIAANIVSCCLIVPGIIVGIVFLCLHWRQGRVPFAISCLGFAIGFLAMLFIPSWTRPV